MSRAVSEWIGKTDDHRAPGSVRQRILAREPCCHLCGLPVDGTKKWDLDHVKALINGGENRESNLRPAHTKCHKDKTARDIAEKAKVAAVRQKHLGITSPKQKIPSNNSLRTRETKDKIPVPAPRAMFRTLGGPDAG